MSVRAIPFALLTLLLFLLCLQAQAADTAAVVKVADPKHIDGDPADWPDSGRLQIADNDGRVATIRTAYDETSFYALFEVKDDSPLLNAAPEPAMILKGGDAVGLCFGPAGTRSQNQRVLIAQLAGKPVAMAYRPEWPEKQLYTFSSPAAECRLDCVVPLPEVHVALKPAPGGYVAEIAIPWRVLGFTPAVSLEFAFDAQVIWSDAAGKINVSTAWWHSTGAGPLCTVDLPTEARLYPGAWGKAKLCLTAPGAESVAAAAAVQVGTPITFELPRDAKASLIVTDRRGWIFRELLVAESMVAGRHTVMWDGRDEYGDPLPPGEYRWKLGYFDGIRSRRLGGAGNSAQPPYRTPDGKGDLGAVHGIPAAVAADAHGVYHLGNCEEGNPGFTKLSPDGACLWKHSIGGFGVGFAAATDDKYVYIVNRIGEKVDLVRIDQETGRGAPIGPKGPRVKISDAKVGDKEYAALSLAIAGGKAFFAQTLPPDTIGVLDLATGELGTSIPVDNLSGICKLNDHALLVCSGTSVLKLNLADNTAAPLITGLEAPRAVAVDKAGTIYVSDLGSFQQIKKYSADGKPLGSLGKPGGRPATCNPYDPAALYQVKSLAISPDGNLWFMEDSNLRRTGVMTADGRFVKDVFMSLPSQGGAGVDLDDASRVFYHPGYGSTVCQAKIDFSDNRPGGSQTWKLEAVFNMTQTGGYAEPAPEDMAAISTANVFYAPIAFKAANGIRYYWQPGQIASLWIADNGRLVPVHAIGPKNSGDGTVVPKDKSYTWSDANADGKLQGPELELTDTAFRNWCWIDRDLVLYGRNGSIKPHKVDARGVPFYRPADFQPCIAPGNKTPDYYYRDAGYDIQPSAPAADGGRYFGFNIGSPQGRAFWDRCTYSRLARAKDGRIQWIAGRHDGRKLRDGDFTYLWAPLGEVDGVVAVSDVDFQELAYTSDGLALGDVMPHPRQSLQPECLVQECVQSGCFIKDPVTGKAMLINGTGCEVHVLEVSGIGPKDIRRIEGKVRLESAIPRSPQTPGRYEILYRTWPSVDNGRFYGVNGDDWEWLLLPEIRDMAIYDGKTLVADVRLRRDCGSLHLYATVLDREPAPSAADGCGIELLIGPAQPAGRTSPIAGDTRILLGALRDNDKLVPFARAGRPSVQDQPGALTTIPGAKVAIRESLNGQGWHLEAEIPLAFLPEISKEREVTFLRNYWPGAKRLGDFLERYTETKFDLAAPVRLNVVLHVTDGRGGSRPLPWVRGNAADPSKWGEAAAPAE